MPPGLGLQYGVLTGIPTAVGTFSFTVRVTDSCKQQVDGILTVQIVQSSKGCPGAALTLVDSLPTFGAAFPGVPYSLQLQRTGGIAPFTYQLLAGELPPGLTLSSSGLISGTTTNPSGSNSVMKSFTVRLTDGCGARAERAMSILQSKATGSGPGPGYGLLVNEGQHIHSTTLIDVAYGADGRFFHRYGVTELDCNNAVFGDPAPGKSKACYWTQRSTTILPGYRYCSREAESCAWSGGGQKLIKFGANGVFAQRSGSSGMACSSANFGGDPVPNVVKACYVPQ
ncbi:MAG: hypothetical protein HY898_35735 [Deltaproteobacteria bacterium]|nr:hypothetical protein [Deltaproteobacteria bacterium]